MNISSQEVKTTVNATCDDLKVMVPELNTLKHENNSIFSQGKAKEIWCFLYSSCLSCMLLPSSQHHRYYQWGLMVSEGQFLTNAKLHCHAEHLVSRKLYRYLCPTSVLVACTMPKIKGHSTNSQNPDMFTQNQTIYRRQFSGNKAALL